MLIGPSMRGGHVDAVSRTHVAGWAADTDQPERALDLCILVNGTEIGRVIADRPRGDIAALGRFGTAGHGFHFAFAPALPADAEHTVTVRHADTMQTLPNGERVLPHDPDAQAPTRPAAQAPAPAAPATPPAGIPPTPLVPILISAPGRSGTTYLMRCLAAAPQIVAATLVPYEVRLLAYYATVFRVLTAQGNLERSTHPDRLEGDGFHIGFNPFTAPQYDGAFRSRHALDAFRDGWLPERFGTALSEAVREYYGRLAADQGKRAVTMFAEKNNNINQPTRLFLRQAFAVRREIAIVRDPRDVLCSHMAYFSSSPEKAFGHLSHSCRQLIALHEKSGGEVFFLRYEDMIRADRATFAALSGFLDAQVEPEASADSAMFRTHGTSQTPEASIGRWRHDLPQAMRAQSTAAWAGFLERFGYETPA